MMSKLLLALPFFTVVALALLAVVATTRVPNLTGTALPTGTPDR